MSQNLNNKSGLRCRLFSQDSKPDSCISEEVTGKMNHPKTSANTVVGYAEKPQHPPWHFSVQKSNEKFGMLATTLRKQNHSCGHCGLKLLHGEKVELHHIDGNHNNSKHKNLLAVHRSCPHYVQIS